MNKFGGYYRTERPLDAMRREFFEETGVATEGADWELFSTTHGRDYEIFYFKAFSDKVRQVRTVTDEIVDVFKVDELHDLPMMGTALRTALMAVEMRTNE